MKFVHEKELGAEDDQVFLVKLQVRRDLYSLIYTPRNVTTKPLIFQSYMLT